MSKPIKKSKKLKIVDEDENLEIQQEKETVKKERIKKQEKDITKTD